MASSGQYIIFSANYLPNIGGVERYTDNLARELVQMGNSVTIVTNNVFDLKQHEQLDDGMEIIRLPCFPLINGRFPIPKHGKSFKAAWSKLPRKACRGILINTRYYSLTIQALRYAHDLNIVPVLLDHSSGYLSFGNALLDVAVRFYERAVTAMGKRYRPAYYSVSKKSADWLSTFGIAAQGVLPNSIDAKDFAAKAGTQSLNHIVCDSSHLKVAFASRLIAEKGILNIIDAASIMNEQNRGLTFYVAGSGPLEGQVRRAASQLDNLYYLGPLSYQEMASLLTKCDVFCYPTQYAEGLPTVLLEAASCSCALISTDTGGTEELIPDSNHGIVLPDSSGAAIAKALNYLCDNPEILNIFQQNIYEHVCDDFSWESTAHAFITACESANE